VVELPEVVTPAATRSTLRDVEARGGTTRDGEDVARRSS
jgi:hypothetical protein